MQVALTAARHALERVEVGLALLTVNDPPVMFMPPSNTRLPPVNVRFVPFPIDRVLQSIHQFPLSTMFPAGTLHEYTLRKRWNAAVGAPDVPTAPRSRSTYAGVTP